MTKQVNLSRLQKCPQKWEDMNPVEGGKLCQRCNKIIVDLRNSSPEEIRKMHILHPESLCGVYSPSQLLEKNKKAFSLRKEFALLGISLLPLVSVAQSNHSTQQNTEQTPVVEKKKNLIEKVSLQNQRDSVYISGRVMEKSADGSSQPIPFASIYIQEIDKGTTTNADGFFEINLSEFENVPDTVTMLVQFIGFAKQTLRNVETEKSQSFNITLQEQEMVAFGVSLEAPKKKGLWSRFMGLFRKK